MGWWKQGGRSEVAHLSDHFFFLSRHKPAAVLGQVRRCFPPNFLLHSHEHSDILRSTNFILASSSRLIFGFARRSMPGMESIHCQTKPEPPFFTQVAPPHSQMLLYLYLNSQRSVEYEARLLCPSLGSSAATLPTSQLSIKNTKEICVL